MTGDVRTTCAIAPVESISRSDLPFSLSSERFYRFAGRGFHELGELVYTKTFPHAERTDIIYIQILLAKIYQVEDKQRMCSHVVDELKAVGIKQDNILIALTENEGSDWFAPEMVG
jgi:hypothetical protein